MDMMKGAFHSMYLVLFMFVNPGDQVQGFTWPPNRAILAGDSVEFACADQPRPAPPYIAYDECITAARPDCRRISADEKIVYTENGGDPARAERYNITRSAYDGFYLNITDAVLEEDAGTYRCVALSSDHVGYNELVILDGEPRCTRNTTRENEAVQGEIIRYVCEAPYRGRYAPRTRFYATHPEALFTYSGDDPDDDSETNIARYSVSLEMTPEHNGAVFVANVYFESKKTEAKQNLGPYYHYTHEFEPLTVFHPPADIETMWPRTPSCLSIGQQVTCRAVANPKPAFKWVDSDTNKVISNIDILEVTQSMMGTASYKCVAYNALGREEQVAHLRFCKQRPELSAEAVPTMTTEASPTTSSGQGGLGATMCPWNVLLVILMMGFKRRIQ